VDVLPSAVLELSWLTYIVARGYSSPASRAVVAIQHAAPDLRDELVAMWGDDYQCLPDTSILAQRVGALLTDEADSFLHGLPQAAQLDGTGLELLSETPEVRQATLERLDRLRRDAGLLARYRDVLARTWELVRGEWEETGREVVRRTCVEWSGELARGTRLLDMLSARHILRKPYMARLIDRRHRVVLTPMYFASPQGGFVIDMTGFLHVGAPAQPADADRLRRDESEVVASRLKVLADGTRLALLRHLVHEPASVMDLARRFRLAQPTVSNHVRLLRDAGLLDSTREGTRVVYSASGERVGHLLSDTQQILLEH